MVADIELQNEKELDELLDLFAHGFNIAFTAKNPELHVAEKDPDDLFPERQHGYIGLIAEALLIHNVAYRLWFEDLSLPLDKYVQ